MTNRTHKRRRSVRWGKLLIVMMALLFSVRLGRQVQQYLSLNEEAEAYRQQLAAVQAEYADKQEQIDLLSNDAYIERLARSRLGMVKQGETVVLTVDADLPTMAAVSDQMDTTLRD